MPSQVPFFPSPRGGWLRIAPGKEISKKSSEGESLGPAEMDAYVRARVCVCVCVPGRVGTDKVSFKDWEKTKQNKKKRFLHVKQAAL